MEKCSCLNDFPREKWKKKCLIMRLTLYMIVFFSFAAGKSLSAADKAASPPAVGKAAVDKATADRAAVDKWAVDKPGCPAAGSFAVAAARPAAAAVAAMAAARPAAAAVVAMAAARPAAAAVAAVAAARPAAAFRCWKREPVRRPAAALHLPVLTPAAAESLMCSVPVNRFDSNGSYV